MQINIPPSEQDRLARHASAAGYSDVSAYVTEYVMALASQPDDIERLSPEALEAGLSMCDQSMAQIDQGESLTSVEARRQSLDHINRLPQ